MKFLRFCFVYLLFYLISNINTLIFIIISLNVPLVEKTDVMVKYQKIRQGDKNMRIEIKFDKRKFERDLKREMEKAEREMKREIEREMRKLR
mgnify:CR=1 FL=1